MDMKHSKRLLNKIHKCLSNLPLELVHEIYKYVLVAEKPVVLLQRGGTDLVYKWRELPEREDRDCEIAFELLVYGPLAVNWHDTYAFFLRSNTFKIRTGRISELLMASIQELCKAGYPAYLGGLIVDVPYDANNAGFFMDPKDHDKNDNRDPELRAFRILRTLLPLDRLHTLHVLVKNDRKGREVFFVGASKNPNIEKIAAVISRLRSLVLSTSRAPDFRVIIQKYHRFMDNSGDDRALRDSPLLASYDITWFWDPLSPDEVERVRCWTQMDKKLNECKASIRRLNGLTKSKRLELEPASESSVTMEAIMQQKKELRSQINALHDQRDEFHQSQQNLSSRLKHDVAEMVADPEWEMKAEAIFKDKSYEGPAGEEDRRSYIDGGYYSPSTDDEDSSLNATTWQE